VVSRAGAGRRCRPLVLSASLESCRARFFDTLRFGRLTGSSSSRPVYRDRGSKRATPAASISGASRVGQAPRAHGIHAQRAGGLPARRRRGTAVQARARQRRASKGHTAAQSSIVLASFENRHAAERMLTSLGRQFRTKARKGHVRALVISGNKDGSLKVTQSRVLTGAGVADTVLRISVAWTVGFIGTVSMLKGAMGLGRASHVHQGHVGSGEQAAHRILAQAGPNAARHRALHRRLRRHHPQHRRRPAARNRTDAPRPTPARLRRQGLRQRGQPRPTTTHTAQTKMTRAPQITGATTVVGSAKLSVGWPEGVSQPNDDADVVSPRTRTGHAPDPIRASGFLW